ncbi:MAG: hypothetical protein AAB569_01335 [Patescibacteria group bacterium]
MKVEVVRSRLQEVCVFIDCQGFVWIFSQHLKPDGNECKLTSPEETKIGRKFVIQGISEKGYYGRCSVCNSNLIAPRNKLSSNC